MEADQLFLDHIFFFPGSDKELAEFVVMNSNRSCIYTATVLIHTDDSVHHVIIHESE